MWQQYKAKTQLERVSYVLYRHYHDVYFDTQILRPTIHYYWAFGGTKLVHYAIPTIHDKPAFKPGFIATTIVAIGLSGLALFVYIMLHDSFDLISYQQNSFSRGAWIFLTIFLMRASGEFKLVGLSL